MEIVVNGQNVEAAIAAAPGLTARANAGATTPKRARLHLLSGSDISIAVTDDGAEDEVEVTISATGTSFPGYYGSAPAQDSGGGAVGVSALVSRGDHAHPISSAYLASSYRMRSSSHVIGPTAGNLSATPSDGGAFTPRLALQVGEITGDALLGVVVGFATSTSGEGCYVDVGSSSGWQQGDFVGSTRTGGSNRWGITVFSSTEVRATRIAGAGSYNGIFFIVGDA